MSLFIPFSGYKKELGCTLTIWYKYHSFPRLRKLYKIYLTGSNKIEPADSIISNMNKFLKFLFKYSELLFNKLLIK